MKATWTLLLTFFDDQFWTGSLRTVRIYEYERCWLWTGTQIFRIKTKGSQKEKARKYTWQFMCSYGLPAVKEEEIENTAWQRFEGRPLRKSLIMIKVSKLIFSFLRWVLSFLQSIVRCPPLRFTPLTPVTKLSLGKLSWNKLIHCLNYLVYFPIDLRCGKEDFIPRLTTNSMILEHYWQPYCFEECF